MKEPVQMTTLVSILEKLRVKKMDHEFQMTDKGFTAGKEKYYQPEDLVIVKTYRFEGDTNPDDSSILYLLQANDGLYGYSLDAYGVYTNHDADYNEFIKKLRIEDRDDQVIFPESEVVQG